MGQPTTNSPIEQSISSPPRERPTPQPHVPDPASPPPPKEIKQSDYTGFTKSRQFRNSNVEQKVLPRAEKKAGKGRVQNIEHDLENLNLQDVTVKGGGKGASPRQGSVPPRLQAEQQKGSKRYSSLRQRSLPETAVPPFSQPANYFPNGK